MISPSPTTIVPEVSPSDPTSGPLDYISASRLNCWSECRLKFRYRYLDRLPTTVSPALHLGKAVHRGLEVWNHKRWRGEPCSPADIQGAFQDFWILKQPDDGIDWQGKEDEQKEKAWKLIKHYIDNSDIPKDERPEGVEVLVERDFQASGYPPLRGVIDLVRPGGRIIDFKTAARSPDTSMVAHLNQVQRTAYALLYREATGKQEQEMEFHYLLKTKEPRVVVVNLPPVTPEHCRSFSRLIESYVSGVSDEDFVPSPGQHCSWCDYLDRCKAHP